MSDNRNLLNGYFDAYLGQQLGQHFDQERYRREREIDGRLHGMRFVLPTPITYETISSPNAYVTMQSVSYDEYVDYLRVQGSDIAQREIAYLRERTGREIERDSQRRRLEELRADLMQSIVHFDCEKVTKADLCAEKLLLSYLTDEQKQLYEKERFFIVHARQYRYRIWRSKLINIEQIGRDGYVMHRLCAGPEGDLPVGDVMLAQKLMLESDETAFLQTARRHGSWGATMPALPAI